MGQERRRSYRCTAQATGEFAILKGAGVHLVVKTLDQSRGGTGVVADQPVQLAPGQMLTLTSPAGSWEVSVKHCEHDDGQTRIGLERVRELDTYSRRGGGWILRRSGLHRPLRNSANALIMVVAAGLLLVWWLGFSPLRLLDGSSRSSSDVWRPSTPLAKLRIADEPTRRERQLRENYLSIGQLNSAQFVQALRLEGAQQKRIEEIVGKMTNELSLVYTAREVGDSVAWTHMSMQLIRRSWEQIQGVLTDEQRVRWDELFRDGTAERPLAQS